MRASAPSVRCSTQESPTCGRCVVHAPVFWIFGERCVEAFVDDPRRLQAFLRVVFDFGRRDEPLVQAVVIVDEPTPAILAFVRLVPDSASR